MSSSPSHEPRRTPPFGRQRPVFARDDVGGAHQQAAERERILIVEDDFLVVAQMENALEDAGFEIAGIASSADEALELASSEYPLLCVMDIRLAGSRDGIDAALDLFRLHSVRCIFATAHHDAEARNRALAAEPLAWLQKPYTMTSLIVAVRRAVLDLSGKKP